MQVQQLRGIVQGEEASLSELPGLVDQELLQKVGPAVRIAGLGGWATSEWYCIRICACRDSPHSIPVVAKLQLLSAGLDK